ncbi:lysosomal acid lipase/cholesteryl ester hydrolase isoform X1 [Alligator mississippiensis]|uniref:lysosomal acid lipase/cholesteryl ester hydrolase isoform X1 n=2 Tax=Alligator mississippiensis TaxID=8496 RepID=UPI0028774553|nr:lysosomal acid lipase/cholesteryl ester hydrolase isoform X1 [Alligator mississippiensis]
MVEALLNRGSARPKMRWLMVFAWFQAITFSEAFRKPATMDFEQVLTKNTVNPECFMNVSEIIRYHGYPSEEHEVVTQDGYILSVNRIPGGKDNGTRGKRPVVFLQHPLLGDATHWISNLPNNSLGFILADAGYDVWLGNSRGNTWSLKHKTLKPKQKAFWRFSFDEVGKYDLPAALHFIMEKTGQEELYYVGHSEGTAVGFAAFLTNPELAKKIKVFFALGPVATVTYATSPLATLGRLPEIVLKAWLGNKGTFQQHVFLKKPFTKLCTVMKKFCTLILSSVTGYNTPNLNTSRMDMYVAHSPAGTAVQNVLHWRQINYAKQFQAYDYGSKEKNMEKYNQTSPPAYEIETLKIPIAAWSAGKDLLADPKDVAILLPRFANLVFHDHFPDWAHLDFIWGLDAAERLYTKIIDLMKKYP